MRAADEVPEAFRSNAGTIGLRMPDNATALALVRAAGCPLATTSANLRAVRLPVPSTLSTPSSPRASARSCPTGPHDDKSGVASTVLDCTQDPPAIVREGAVTLADIRALA